MGQRKYFFFDYDGTLAVPHTRYIPESTLRTLDVLQSAGHFVCLNTGRLQCNALDYISSVGLKNIVADGGYSVTLNGQLQWMRPLDLEPVQECLRRCDQAGIPWSVTVANELKRYSSNPDFEKIAGDYYVPTIFDPELSVDNLRQVFKAYIPCEVDRAQDLADTGLLDGVPWVTYTSSTIFIEPMSKDEGIRWVMKHFDAPLEDVVVFGDGKNDLSMFCPEWTSIAMGNARQELKEKADFITADCDKDGIYLACKHFGWLE